MPMLTTVRIRSPVAPTHEPSRTASANAAIRAEHLVHVGDDVVAVDARRARPAGWRSAVCSTARRSVTLIGSPANIASRRASTPAAVATASRASTTASSTRCFDQSMRRSPAVVR